MAVEFALLSSSLRLMVLQILLLGFLCLNKFSSTHFHLWKLYNSNPSSTKLIIIYQMHTKFLCTEKFKLSFCCFVMSSWFCFIFYLDQGLTNFFYTGPDIEYFRLVDHTISATKTKICQYSKNIQLIHQPQSASRPMRRCGLFPAQFAGPHHPRSHSSALHGSLLSTLPL